MFIIIILLLSSTYPVQDPAQAGTSDPVKTGKLGPKLGTQQRRLDIRVVCCFTVTPISPRESFYLAGPRLGSSFAEFYVRMCERATALLKGSEMASLVLVDTI